MTKNNRPTIDNPLASMGLDDIVRGITASGNDAEAGAEDANETSETPKKTGKPRRGGKKAFEENLAKYPYQRAGHRHLAAEGSQEKTGAYPCQCEP